MAAEAAVVGGPPARPGRPTAERVEHGVAERLRCPGERRSLDAEGTAAREDAGVVAVPVEACALPRESDERLEELLVVGDPRGERRVGYDPFTCRQDHLERAAVDQVDLRQETERGAGRPRQGRDRPMEGLNQALQLVRRDQPPRLGDPWEPGVDRRAGLANAWQDLAREGAGGRESSVEAVERGIRR